MATLGEGKAGPSSAGGTRHPSAPATHVSKQNKDKKSGHRHRSNHHRDEGSQDSSSKIVQDKLEGSDTSKQSAASFRGGRRRKSYALDADLSRLSKRSVDCENAVRVTHVLERSRRTHKSPRVGFVLLLFFALLFVALFLLALFVKKQEGREPTSTCSSRACFHHGQVLRDALNLSADPCDDFHAFVCGSWERRLNEGPASAAPAYQDRLMVAFAERAIDELQSNLVKLEGSASEDANQTMHLAARFFRSCTRSDDSESAVSASSTTSKMKLQLFRELRMRMRLPWPELTPPTTIEPLDVMLDLAINWNENFLFDAQLVNVSGRPVTLFLSRGKPLTGWVHYEEPANYEGHVQDYVGYMGLSEAAGGNEAHPHLLRNLTRDMLNVKRDGAKGEASQTWFRLDLFDNPTPWVDAGVWLSLLNKHFSPDLSWSSDHLVVVEDAGLVRGIQKLLKKYSKRQFLIGLSWLFVQTHLWAILDLPQLRFHSGASDDLTLFATLKNYSCLEYVQSRLGSLLPFGETINSLPSNSPELFEVVVKSATSLLDQLAWIGNARHAALQKTKYMTSSSLPRPAFFDLERREQLFDTFPRMGADFTVNFVHASHWYQATRKHRNRLGLYGLRTSAGYARPFYVYALNSVRFPMTMLQPPLYYNLSDMVVLNAGAGSVLAREVARAFDRKGVALDEEGRGALWWGPNRSRDYRERLACDMNASECCSFMQLFPSVPGLEIAYHAFELYAEHDQRLPGLEKVTHDQLFFINYCYVQCAGSRANYGDSCNVPLRNFAPFGKAFKCSAGSRMSPRPAHPAGGRNQEPQSTARTNKPRAGGPGIMTNNNNGNNGNGKCNQDDKDNDEKQQKTK
ncbi:neprilysin-1-like [Dermacentor andersoni]|uniref:neprilysin-1-like n=1 Tax=Dermacentor andersoni TaxID=34620 RepID=UPI003B3B8387